MPFTRANARSRLTSVRLSFGFNNLSGLTEFAHAIHDTPGALVSATTGIGFLGDGNVGYWSAVSNDKYKLYSYDLSLADATHSMEIAFGTSQIDYRCVGYLLARIADTDNLVYMSANARGVGAVAEVKLFEVIAGVTTQVGSTVTYSYLTAATAYKFELNCDGSTLTAYVKNIGGSTIASTSGTTTVTTSGLCGLGANVNNNGNQSVYIDNWIVSL